MCDNVLRRCHVRIPCWHQLHNSKVLVVQGIHSLASQMDVDPDLAEYTPAQYQTMAFDLGT